MLRCLFRSQRPGLHLDSQHHNTRFTNLGYIMVTC
uniref:Uncharacterized protein n=1 Tax=Rhizophora mucronata TaxID=61149 RepID=A0A2P2NGN1_RHIMU